MRLRVGGACHEGRVVDLRASDVDGAAVARSVRGEALTPAVSPTATAAVYRYAGHVRPGMGLRTRTALAAAARSRGVTAPQDDAIADLRARLADLDPDRPDLPARTGRVPEGAVRELEEAVATHRGRVRAHERLPAGDASEPREDLRAAARRLSERETERTAARQTRERRRDAARGYRQQLERRRRLADELANRRREARAHLVDSLEGRFRASLATLPGPTPEDPFDAPPVDAALATLRVARTEAPVVLEVDRFASPAAAARQLSAPVVRC
ncbi:hypothetical protein ACFQGE_07785 [Halomicroarcula sp. GCM10025817]|uniref:DUF7856 family protein n=1 Tax=Haloarcula TaxID=2237 RepID=UPI0023E8D3B9|nr:hypothetical protein [Halomicroarcula sp. SYNS111]